MTGVVRLIDCPKGVLTRADLIGNLWSTARTAETCVKKEHCAKASYQHTSNTRAIAETTMSPATSPTKSANTAKKWSVVNKTSHANATVVDDTRCRSSEAWEHELADNRREHQKSLSYKYIVDVNVAFLVTLERCEVDSASLAGTTLPRARSI